ncbi:SGNH/GDSL hydrolase family protein [Vibrio nomapromontoriensis]|uniref:SGNH/GDSL hydrolase family protein n=1 Tax=Vibrio nomapromontoriensis TaxID=2910246 RepID=UPI003D0B913A
MDIKYLIASTITALTFNAYAATSYNEVVVFGDSLSDVGNLHLMNFPGGPAEGQTYGPRFSNGPLIAEYVASKVLDIDVDQQPLLPSLHLVSNITGNNFAVAGAKSLDDDGSPLTPDINLPTQINAYLQHTQSSADKDALYFMSIGGNDVRSARDLITSKDGNQPFFSRKLSAYTYTYNSAVSASNSLELLLKSGAKDIVVLGVPNISMTPENTLITDQLIYNANNFWEQLSAMAIPRVVGNLSKFYQGAINSSIEQLENDYPSANIHYVDLMSIVDTVNQDIESYSFTDTTHACNYLLSTSPVGQPTSECLVTSEYLYFDELHPTTAANMIVADKILAMLESKAK